MLSVKELNEAILAEMTILKQTVYKKLGPFRRDKTLAALKKIHRCLQRHIHEKLLDSLSENRATLQSYDLSLINQPWPDGKAHMMSSLTKKLIVEAELMKQTKGYAMESFLHCKSKLMIGDYIPTYALYAALSSRVWFLCHAMLSELITLYSRAINIYIDQHKLTNAEENNLFPLSLHYLVGDLPELFGSTVSKPVHPLADEFKQPAFDEDIGTAIEVHGLGYNEDIGEPIDFTKDKQLSVTKMKIEVTKNCESDRFQPPCRKKRKVESFDAQRNMSKDCLPFNTEVYNSFARRSIPEQKQRYEQMGIYGVSMEHLIPQQLKVPDSVPDQTYSTSQDYVDTEKHPVGQMHFTGDNTEQDKVALGINFENEKSKLLNEEKDENSKRNGTDTSNLDTGALKFTVSSMDTGLVNATKGCRMDSAGSKSMTAMLASQGLHFKEDRAKVKNNTEQMKQTIKKCQQLLKQSVNSAPDKVKSQGQSVHPAPNKVKSQSVNPAPDKLSVNCALNPLGSAVDNNIRKFVTKDNYVKYDCNPDKTFEAQSLNTNISISKEQSLQKGKNGKSKHVLWSRGNKWIVQDM